MTSVLPEATPLGGLACQLDSFKKSFESVVLSCNEVQEEKSKYFELELADTILFPEGGGQPCDFGKINGEVVDKVYGRNGRCIHRLASRSHNSPPFSTGQMVKIEVDWERRFDHMQQHSAQHLFSAIAENKKYGVDTTTWSLGEERCNVEFVPLDSSPYHEKMTGQKMISREILQKMEDDVNHAIIDSLAMTPRQIRPGTDEWKLVENKFSPDAFPDIVRVVSIEGVDVNPCCGTHVTNTAQLQCIKILNAEFARGATRVWFVAGTRVSMEFSRMFLREQMLTKLLTCAPEEHESRTDKVLQFQKSAVKDIKNMQKEIAVLVAEKILNECEENSESFGVVHYHREEGDMVFMQSLLAALGDARNQYVFVLSVGKSSSEGMFMIAGPSEFVTAHAKEVVGIIDGKGGGGKNGTYQGKAKSMKKMSDLVNKLKELRVSSCSG